MKVIAKKNRELALINAQNTQNENRAEIITLVVPEEYEDYNKKIVFVTDDGTVWDVITNNEYKITNAITKYEKVDFYIWLTKEVDGESIDFRTKTKTLNFYHNEDASDEITDEEIHGVNTVVNLLEEEIEKVENLNIEATKVGNTTTITITKKDGTTESVEINDGVDGQDGQDGYTPQKGVDYFTEQDIEEIEGDILNEVYTKSETDTLLEEKADVEDIPDVSSFITKDVNNLTNYTLKTNTGSLIDLEINDTTYVVTLKLKNQDGTIISTDTIDLPLESVVVSGRYDNTTKKVILTLENGSEVDFSVADLVAGLQTEITSQNKLASDLVDDTNSGNKFVTTTEKQTWNNKLDESDLTDYVKNTDYASSSKGGVIKATGAYGVSMQNSGAMYATNTDFSTYQNVSQGYFIGKGTLENVIAGKQLINQTQLEESQESQDEEIEALQTENARLKVTLPTTTGEGQAITLDKTAEFEFIKPPLPMGNSEQIQYSGKNLFLPSLVEQTTSNNVTCTPNGDGTFTLNGTSNASGRFTISSTPDKLYFTLEELGFSLNDQGFLNGCPVGGSDLSPTNSYKLFMSGQSGASNINDGGSGSIINANSSNMNGKYYLSIDYASGVTFNNLVFKPMIVKGITTATSYEPYVGGTASPNPDYPQEITNVTGDVEVKVQNKNLWKIKNYSKTGWNITIDNPLKGLSAGNYTLSTVNKYITANKGMTIYFSDIVNGSMNDKIGEVFVSYEFGNTQMSNTKSITQEQINANYLIIGPQDINCTQEVLENMGIMIEKNSTSTPYTPHKSQTFTFPLGNEKLMLGDYLADDGIHHVRGQVELNQNNIGVVLAVSTYNSKSLATIQRVQLGMIKNYNVNTALISTYKEETNLSNIASGKFSTTADNTSIWIFDDRFTDLATARNLLLGTIIEFELEQEVIVPYTSAQQEVYNQIKQALSYEEQTNISGSSDESNPIFSVEAYQSTKLVLEEMATAIVALGGV